MVHGGTVDATRTHNSAGPKEETSTDRADEVRTPVQSKPALYAEDAKAAFWRDTSVVSGGSVKRGVSGAQTIADREAVKEAVQADRERRGVTAAEDNKSHAIQRALKAHLESPSFVDCKPCEIYCDRIHLDAQTLWTNILKHQHVCPDEVCSRRLLNHSPQVLALIAILLTVERSRREENVGELVTPTVLRLLEQQARQKLESVGCPAYLSRPALVSAKELYEGGWVLTRSCQQGPCVAMAPPPPRVFGAAKAPLATVRMGKEPMAQAAGRLPPALAPGLGRSATCSSASSQESAPTADPLTTSAILGGLARLRSQQHLQLSPNTQKKTTMAVQSEEFRAALEQREEWRNATPAGLAAALVFHFSSISMAATATSGDAFSSLATVAPTSSAGTVSSGSLTVFGAAPRESGESPSKLRRLSLQRFAEAANMDAHVFGELVRSVKAVLGT